MKKLLVGVLALISLATFSADFERYECTDSSRNTAELGIDNENMTVSWNELWHSASSNGEYTGIEQSPYSDMKGYYKFKLTSFYQTEDSMYILALNSLSDDRINAVIYFDNDDHYEAITAFSCTQKL